MNIAVPCFACGASVTLTASIAATNHPGDPTHHQPPSTSATGSFVGTCPCGASLRLSYLGGLVHSVVEHAHDGSKQCPYCGLRAAA